MYTKQRLSFIESIAWTWWILPPLGLYAGAIVAGYSIGGQEWLQLPPMSVGVLGTAVSFYLGFKGSAAYERLWEARKIWGGIVNTSRTWGTLVTTFVSDLHREQPGETPLAEVHRELLYRHVAWLAALRLQLRRPKPWEHRASINDTYRELYGTLDTSDERLAKLWDPLLSPEEITALLGHRNRATQLIQAQGVRLKELYAEQRIEDFRHIKLIDLLEELYTLQGKCERIKNFPLPRQYSSTNHWLVMIFILLLPFALVGSLAGQDVHALLIWSIVPLTCVIGWAFFAWDQTLEYTENPFEGLINDIPMDALSRTIEIDLREMLGESDLPAPVQAYKQSVLM
jgi:putative membrane protein